MPYVTPITEASSSSRKKGLEKPLEARGPTAQPTQWLLPCSGNCIGPRELALIHPAGDLDLDLDQVDIMGILFIPLCVFHMSSYDT